MDECCVCCEKMNGELQLFVVYFICNFNVFVGDKFVLFIYDEVVIMFYEFGYGIYYMFIKMCVVGVFGINGVLWDVVELLSQFLENWCWEEDVFNFIFGYYEIGELFFVDLLECMFVVWDYQLVMQMVCQFEFSFFDFLLYSEKGSEVDVQGILDKVCEEVVVVIFLLFNCF